MRKGPKNAAPSAAIWRVAVHGPRVTPVQDMTGIRVVRSGTMPTADEIEWEQVRLKVGVMRTVVHLARG